MPVDTGGFAFPNTGGSLMFPGMTLLDFWAGEMAIAILIAQLRKVRGEDELTPDSLAPHATIAAEAAYNLAEALVAEKNEREA